MGNFFLFTLLPSRDHLASTFITQQDSATLAHFKIPIAELPLVHKCECEPVTDG